MEQLMIAKVVISMGIVFLLAEISKRANPVLGGILSGLPLGTGLAVYFISYEQGISFVLEGIPWGIAALASQILFCFVYFTTGMLLKERGKLVSLAAAIILGLLAFFIGDLIILQLQPSLLGALLLFGIVYTLNLIAMQKLYKNDSKKSQKKHTKLKYQILIRAVIVAFIVIGITGFAPLIGSQWSGILSSFPITLLALLAVLHIEAGHNLYPSVIYGYSFSVSTLVFFYLLCLFLLPNLGLNLGFIIVYVSCILYLLVFSTVRRKLEMLMERRKMNMKSQGSMK